MSHTIYFFAQTGLPDPAVWEVSLSDLQKDYSVELEEREDGAPVYGEILKGGEELVEFELYAPAQTAETFDGSTGQAVFNEVIQQTKLQRALGKSDICVEIDKTQALLVLSVQWGERDDEQVFRDLEPLVDWLHKTAKGIRYEDSIGFFDASSKL